MSSGAWPVRALFTVGFLGVTAGTQMADRGLQAVLLSDIQRTYAVGDASIGALQGLAGMLLGSAIAVPIARLGDRYARKRILLGLVAGWSLLVAAGAFAPDFPLFFVARMLAGASEFALIPIVYSAIPDLVPDRHRVYANLAFAALMALGMSAGFYWGQAIVEAAQHALPLDIDAWRKAYLLLAAVGGPLLVVGSATLDPPRRAPASDVEAPASILGFVATRGRAIALFVGVAGGLMVAVQPVTALMALALERRFGADIGVVGRSLGVITLATSIGCLPVAGALDRMLRHRQGRRARPIVMGVAVSAAIPCAAVLPAVQGIAPALAAVAAFLFLTCTANALVPTILQDLAPPRVRSRVFAIWSFVVSIFCAAGPLAAGFISEHLDGRMLVSIGLTAVPALCASAACSAAWVLRTPGSRRPAAGAETSGVSSVPSAAAE